MAHASEPQNESRVNGDKKEVVYNNTNSFTKKPKT